MNFEQRRKKFDRVVRKWGIEQENHYLNCLETVEVFFGDKAKAERWMSAENPLFGDISPVEMIAFGREDRLGMFLQMAREERK
jgi:hypothetical protein